MTQEEAVKLGIEECFEQAGKLAAQAATDINHEYCRPSVIYRPKISQDGNQWCVIYGDNIQEGVAGFGATPYEAMKDFDKNWYSQILPST